MNNKYFPDYENIRERLDNLVTHAENKDFGDLDLGMEGLYFNIQDLIDLIQDRFKEYDVTYEQLDEDAKILIKRALDILLDNFLLY